MGRQLDQDFVVIDARDNHINPAFQIECHIFDRFALSHPDRLMIEINRRSAHLCSSEVECHACAQTRFFKNKRHTAAGHRLTVFAWMLLEFGCRR